MGGGACFPSSLGSFHRAPSLPRMTSQTKASPFLQKRKKKKIWRQESSQRGQVLFESMLDWVLPPGFCSWHKVQCPLPIHTSSHIPSPSRLNAPRFSICPPGWFRSAVDRATLVFKHTSAVVRTLHMRSTPLNKLEVYC